MPIVWRKDNGSGGLTDALGNVHAGATVNYAAGSLNFLPDVYGAVPSPTYSKQKIGKENGIDLSIAGISGYEASDQFDVYRAQLENVAYNSALNIFPVAGGWVKARYRTAGSLNAHQHTETWDSVDLDLTPEYKENIVPGSVRATFGGKTLLDRLGTIVTDLDHATGAATAVGAVDYGGGSVTLDAWTPGAANSGSVVAMLTNLNAMPVDTLAFRVPAVPVRPGSFIFQFVRIGEEGLSTVTAATNGEITAPNVYGSIDYETGIVRLRFGAWVIAAGNEAQWWYDADGIVDGKVFRPDMVMADTLRFACVSYSYLPLDADVLGLNPVRLPTDGRVVVFKPGDVLVVHHNGYIVGTYNNQSVNCGRTRLARVRVFDSAGDAVDPAKWTSDLDAGTVQIGDMSGVSQPITIEHRVEDMSLCSDAQINGLLTVTRPLTHDFPIPGSHVSSALIVGDMQARYSNLFEQSSWTGVWSDTLIGSQPTASYNDAIFPVEVDNAGAIQERWALIFTSTTQVRVVGENVGQIAEGQSISNPISLNNPATGRPYFTIQPGGWGTGWAAGNVLRFNTVASNFPVWVARTIQQGPATEDSDSFCLQIRGDIDAE